LKIPTSGKFAPDAKQGLDPSGIVPCSVFRCNYQFDGDPYALPNRRFVCLGHKDLENKSPFAICLKATSQLDAYKNNPRRLAGSVLYKAGVVPIFEKDTIIQPDNQFPIPHSNLLRQYAAGDFAVLGVLPANFIPALLDAIEQSFTMSANQKRRLHELLKLIGS
jgi:hypothetical protein